MLRKSGTRSIDSCYFKICGMHTCLFNFRGCESYQWTVSRSSWHTNGTHVCTCNEAICSSKPLISTPAVRCRQKLLCQIKQSDRQMFNGITFTLLLSNCEIKIRGLQCIKTSLHHDWRNANTLPLHNLRIAFISFKL